MTDLTEPPEEHQRWRNHKAWDYARMLDLTSKELQDIMNAGAVLQVMSVNDLELVAERIMRVVEKARGREAA